MKIFKGSLVAMGLASMLLLSGCGQDQLLLKTYSAPKKPDQVKKMIVNSDSKDGYINIQIVKDNQYSCKKVSESKTCFKVVNSLNSDLEKFINQTSFISLNSTDDDAAVSLDSQILELRYTQPTPSDIDAFVKVEYNIRSLEKGQLYSAVYEYSDQRHSRAGKQGLPSKSEILSEATNYLAKKLIKDISPLKTSKLVALKDLPDALKYTVNYAKGKNFKGAIKAMENYKGKKDLAYYFDLAVYYECYASKQDDTKYLVKAEENYEKAMAMGGSEDETVIKGKMKFDNFYSIIKEVIKQKVANAKRNNQFEIE